MIRQHARDQPGRSSPNDAPVEIDPASIAQQTNRVRGGQDRESAQCDELGVTGVVFVMMRENYAVRPVLVEEGREVAPHAREAAVNQNPSRKIGAHSVARRAAGD